MCIRDRLFSDRPQEYGTVGWVGVGDMSNNVFVPCYPMLLDDIYEGYQTSTAVVTKSDKMCIRDSFSMLPSKETKSKIRCNA